MDQIGKYINKRNYYRDMSMRINTSKGVKWVIKKALIELWYSKKKYNNKYHTKLENLKQKYSKTEGDTVANLLCVNPQNVDMLVRPKIWYEKYIEVPFEFVTIRISSYYDDYLKKAYGNWHNFVVSESIHGDIIFDTHKSYKEKLKGVNK